MATETVARLRHLRTSPTKVRQVVNLIRGQDVAEARDTLRLCERAVAREVSKVLDSAIANAEHNDNVAEDELYVVRAFVDEGPTGKRWRPRARGRGTRIRKRTSHLTIVVTRYDEEKLERRRRAEAAAGGPSRRRPVRRRQKPAEHDHDHDELDESVVGDGESADEGTAERETQQGDDGEPDAAGGASEAIEGSTGKKSTTKKKATGKKSTTKKKATAKKADPEKGK